MEQLFAGLNEQQRQAVTTTQGPLLIIAGPGSGKTRVITQRIAYLILHEHVSPWNILAVTFTNRAAREMRERLEKLVGGSRTKTMTIGTFHSIGARVLRHEPDYLARYGLSTKYTIFDQNDQLKVVKQALSYVDVSDLDLDQQRPTKVADILAAISRAKSRMQTPEQMAEFATKEAERLAARVYRHYHQLLRASNGLDFDDLLLLPEHLWRSEQDRLRVYQDRWRYLHVDEFQDCNLPQYKFVRLLAYGTTSHPAGLGNVCVVGDDDQMIYSWRGASSENVIRFEQDFPNRELILLEQNYRSTQTILDAAQCLVQCNPDRKPKHLWTEKQGGKLIQVHTAIDDMEEARAVAHEIQRLKGHKHVEQWREIAVLYRMNAQSRALEVQLRSALIPYLVIGSRSFYDRKEIKDILAYLRVIANPHDDISLERIVNTPSRAIGEKSVRELRAFAKQHSLSLYQVIEQVRGIKPLTARAKSALFAFGKLIATLVDESTQCSVASLIDQIVERTGYQQELVETSTEDIDRAANVAELRRVAEEFDEEDFHTNLQQFLEHTALVGGADLSQTAENGRPMSDQEQEGVRLITLHAAKGLEFPVVFIVGLDEGSLPHSFANIDLLQLEEERRLAYVGCTRAMQRLYLYRAHRRYLFGEWRDVEASRFLDDIAPHLMEDVN
jgi:DNA helicase-2/ATP-dependent DNA helicase PcrA